MAKSNMPNWQKMIVFFGIILIFFLSATISSIVSAILAMINPADFVLIFLSGILSLAAIVWGVRGAWMPPGFWITFVATSACMAVGVSTLLIALNRYPPIHPYITGLVATLCFVVLAAASSWPSLHNATPAARKDTNTWSPAGRHVMLTNYVVAGVIGFFPAVVMANSYGEVQPPVTLSGIVIDKMYEIHGWSAVPYLMIGGPAGAYGSAMTAGKYKVPYPTFRNTDTGTRICVILHTGILRFRWWQIGGCPGDAAMPAQHRSEPGL